MPKRLKVRRTIFERLAPYTMTAFGISRTLYQGETQFQKAELHESPDHGKLLLLDGDLQSASSDEYIYHEALVHPALLAHPAPRRVAVLGGGEGATLREVLKHPCVEEAVMIDIDGELVELCRQLMPEQADGSFEDPRSRLIIGDALAWLKEQEHPLDVIISDLTEPSSSELSSSLFTEEFFNLVKSRLAPGGVFALQASEANLQGLSRHRRIRRQLDELFEETASMACFIPSFRCMWSFAVASDQVAPKRLNAAQVQSRIAERRLTDLRFYDGETHQHIFALPRPLRDKLA